MCIRDRYKKYLLILVYFIKKFESVCLFIAKNTVPNCVLIVKLFFSVKCTYCTRLTESLIEVCVEERFNKNN